MGISILIIKCLVIIIIMQSSAPCLAANNLVMEWTGSWPREPIIAQPLPHRATFRPCIRPETSPSTPRPNSLDDELPTRLPLNRFRPTRGPAEDEDKNTHNSDKARFNSSSSSGNTSASSIGTGGVEITSICFECICEASTNCNVNSRCQTSDLRHTRCGMFLISYNQWLATGMSREFITGQTLARDVFADERAFYFCATNRNCAERLLFMYLLRNQKDCDRDGRVDCYDMAAMHHSGPDQCAGESLLNSQYWNDFNACSGFGL